MDLYSFAPIAAVLDVAYLFLSTLTQLLHPLTGQASAVAAIVLLTVLVRLALIPVGISQVRAERTRRRLAPALHDLRKRFAKDPAALQRKTMELYSRENASPLAGCLPLLLQAPVLSIVYGLFVLGTINGHSNTLLSATLGGVPLGNSLASTLLSGATWQAAVVFAILLAALATVAALSRRTALAQARLDAPAAGAVVPPAAAGLPAIGPQLTSALSWAPFITVVVAAVVPLAAAVYLTVSTSWTLAERAILRARLR